MFLKRISLIVHQFVVILFIVAYCNASTMEHHIFKLYLTLSLMKSNKGPESFQNKRSYNNTQSTFKSSLHPFFFFWNKEIFSISLRFKGEIFITCEFVVFYNQLAFIILLILHETWKCIHLIHMLCCYFYNIS